MTRKGPPSYAIGLLATYGLAVLCVMGSWCTSGALMALAWDIPLIYLPAVAVLALAQIPVIAAVALVVRDHSPTRALFALPAVPATMVLNGIGQFLVFAAASGMSL